jgi:homoserine dehydrogenase
VETAYYLRISAEDRPGVMAAIAGILGDQGISIEAIKQKQPEEGETHVPLILLTHRVLEGRMNEAIARIEALDSVKGEVVRIRMENLAG